VFYLLTIIGEELDEIEFRNPVVLTEDEVKLTDEIEKESEFYVRYYHHPTLHSPPTYNYTII
jgi:hypothetical protein